MWIFAYFPSVMVQIKNDAMIHALGEGGFRKCLDHRGAKLVVLLPEHVKLPPLAYLVSAPKF